MRIYKNSIARFVLLALERTIDGYCRIEDFTYHHYRYKYGIPELKKSSLAAAIRRLRLSGLVDVNQDSSGVMIKLTQLGHDALGDLIFDEKKWDGKWRLVIFDIPEDKRGIRDLLRRKLKDWGFRSFQKSVWVCKNDVTDKLRKLIGKLGLEDWVAIIESDDEAISNIYNL